jgi:murein DD-endopeptidase MepM/ murein hydrolase activator NlpD
VQKEADITYNDIKSGDVYKPSYLRGGYVSDKKGGVVRDLRLEEDAKKEVEEVEKYEGEEIEEKKVEIKHDDKITQIVVQKGDTLLKYQRKYGIMAEEIARMNNIKKPYNIYVGQTIKIKGASHKEDIGDNLSKKTKYKTVIVESGDSLLGLSIKYNSNVRELANINNIPAPYNIYAGQKLKVPDNGEAKKTVTQNQNREIYTVERGDSLLLIAKKTGVKFNDLIRINDLKKPYSVYIGQKLSLSNDGSVRPQTEEKDFAIQQKHNNNGESIKNTEAIKPNENITVKNANNEFIKPLDGVIVKNFGDNSNGKFFDGIIIKGNKGEAVRVADDGEVAYVGNELKDLGNIIIVKHKNNWLSIYGYCDTMNVKTKDVVKRGDVIASVGKTGSATDYQLYFAIRRGKVAVDPVKYLLNN